MQFCGGGQRPQRRDVHQVAIPTSNHLRRIPVSLFPAGWHLSGGDISCASLVQVIEVIKPIIADDARMFGRMQCHSTILKRLPGFGCREIVPKDARDNGAGEEEAQYASLRQGSQSWQVQVLRPLRPTRLSRGLAARAHQGKYARGSLVFDSKALGQGHCLGAMLCRPRSCTLYRAARNKVAILLRNDGSRSKKRGIICLKWGMMEWFRRLEANFSGDTSHGP